MAEGGISNKQAMLYLGITFACFAILYPSLFHPIVRGLLKGKEQNDTKPEPPLPEQMKRSAERKPGRPPMRSGAPPAAHADSAHTTTGQTQSSGKGGIVGFVLPVYAIGIVVYLVYVVSKVYMGGEKKGKNKLEETDVYESLHKKLSAIDFERVLRGDDHCAMEELTALAEQLKQYRSQSESCDFDNNKETVLPARDMNTGHAKKDAGIDDQASEAVAADEYSLDELLDQADQLNNLTSGEAQKLQKKLLEAEVKIARMAEALRKAASQTEQLLSGTEDMAELHPASTAAEEVDAIANSVLPPNPGDDEYGNNSAHKEMEQIETIGASPEINGTCSSSTSGIRKRATTKSPD